MTFDKVKDIVARGESDTVEFKKTTGQLDRGMETLCAFLNGEGGVLLFGVHDDGKIEGQDVSDSTKRDIADALARFEPSISPEVSYVAVPHSKKTVIAITATNQRFRRPFFYRNVAYRRMESTTIPMPQDLLQEMMMLRGGKEYIWESLAAEGVSLSDIDEKLVRGAVNLGIFHNRLPESAAMLPLEEMLKGFKLYTATGELTNAAMVLFGKNMLNYPQCLLRLAKFNGSSKLDDFIDNQQVEGNIYEMIDAAMSFFVKHLNISGSINPSTWHREDELPIPRKALRESIINACAHRLYHRRGSSIGIAIYTDRIEVINTGTFPAGISEKALPTNDESEPLNPIIANVLFRTSYLEHWGRGIRMMIDECMSRKLKCPTFTTDGHSVKVIFYLPTQQNVSDKKSGNDSEEISPNDYTLDKSTLANALNVHDGEHSDVSDRRQNVSDNKEHDLDHMTRGDMRRKVLVSLMLSHPSITTTNLASLLKVSLKTISRDINVLVRDGKIRREGGDFGGKWVVIE